MHITYPIIKVGEEISLRSKFEGKLHTWLVHGFNTSNGEVVVKSQKKDGSWVGKTISLLEALNYNRSFSMAHLFVPGMDYKIHKKGAVVNIQAKHGGFEEWKIHGFDTHTSSVILRDKTGKFQKIMPTSELMSYNREPSPSTDPRLARSFSELERIVHSLGGLPGLHSFHEAAAIVDSMKKVHKQFNNHAVWQEIPNTAGLKAAVKRLIQREHAVESSGRILAILTRLKTI